MRYNFSGVIEDNVATTADDAIAAALGVNYGDMYQGYVEFDEELLDLADEDPETSEVTIDSVDYSLTIGNTTFTSTSSLSPPWEPTATFARLLETDYSYQATDPDEASRDLLLWGLTVESAEQSVGTEEVVLQMNGITFQAPFVPGGIAIASPQGGYIRMADGLADDALLLGDAIPQVVENGMPVAQDDAVTTDEDNALSGNVLSDNGSGADSDPDGDSLTVTAVNGSAANVGSQISLGSGALLTLNADGTFTYNPNGQFEDLDTGDTDTDSFSYTVSDGNNGTDSADVTVTIQGVTDTSNGTDSDGDGVPDDQDNAILVPNPDQRDTDGDGYGNVADADLNNDLIVNSIDIGLFKDRLLSTDPDADYNGDGIVNSIDLGLMKGMLLQPPGPSYIDDQESQLAAQLQVDDAGDALLV